MNYLMEMAEEIVGKLQKRDKQALIDILKQYALYNDAVRADLQLRLSSSDKVLEAALRRIRASFEPCYRRGKHYVNHNDVYEALFGASAVLLVAEDDNAGFQPRERLLMRFAVLEEMGRIYNNIDDSGQVGMTMDDAFKDIALLAAGIPVAELSVLLDDHLQRGKELYNDWPERKEELLEALGPFLGGET